MGYDHFALLGLTEDVSDEEFDIVKKCLKELREEHDHVIFGEVHHLCSGGFNDYWWNLFNESMKILYEKTKIEVCYLYVCEFDGESLTKCKYVKGEKVKETEVIINTNDVDVSCDWNIDSLTIKYNLTYFYNKKYPFGYN